MKENTKHELHQVCILSVETKTSRFRWDKAALQVEALKYTSRSEFKENKSGAYTAAYKLGILDQICSHMSRSKPVNTKWDKAALQAEALKYTYRIEFAEFSASAYSVASRLGILDQICSHMSRPISKKRKWSDEALKAEALKYDSKSVFRKKNLGAYQAAKKRQLLGTICGHMKSKHNKWDAIALQNESLKYTDKNSFKAGSSGAYTSANKLGILDQICSHMKNFGNSSKPESNLEDMIKRLYPKAQKLIDRKVKIDGKPHIKGFEIDIYIPELRKGIEFDGDYWHSPKGLRRSGRRTNWPEEDIQNYHKLKDEHFKAKGIEILHIKECEWRENKESQIKKCLSFLSK